MDLHTALFTSAIGSNAAANGASSGAGDAPNQRARAAATLVEARLDRALMTMEAMWRLMKGKLEVTDEELVEMIVEVDISDGQIDGRARRPAPKCASCERAVAPKFMQCMYCGAPIDHEPFA
jgi:hypothetical protein